MTEVFTIAISKGRILKEALPLLARANIIPRENPVTSRKMIIATNRTGMRIIVVRAADVPTYVEYGAADVGITGKDVLLEYNGDGLYEPLDLGIARCRLMLAGSRESRDDGDRLRVATKYINTTLKYFSDRGRQVEIIRLYGSMELAPVLGLADRIVDLVDTGNTLKANGLVPLEKIADISSHLIVNKAVMKMRQPVVKTLISELAKVISK
jgi:ATP phosphoribosyltransferase